MSSSLEPKPPRSASSETPCSRPLRVNPPPSPGAAAWLSAPNGLIWAIVAAGRSSAAPPLGWGGGVDEGVLGREVLGLSRVRLGVEGALGGELAAAAHPRHPRRVFVVIVVVIVVVVLEPGLTARRGGGGRQRRLGLLGQLLDVGQRVVVLARGVGGGLFVLGRLRGWVLTARLDLTALGLIAGASGAVEPEGRVVDPVDQRANPGRGQLLDVDLKEEPVVARGGLLVIAGLGGLGRLEQLLALLGRGGLLGEGALEGPELLLGQDRLPGGLALREVRRARVLARVLGGHRLDPAEDADELLERHALTRALLRWLGLALVLVVVLVRHWVTSAPRAQWLSS